ncbi:MAG TPA: type II toxin-antitoxin system VapC family toxin [Tepidisphaeraceae bacterium]|jgi:PIN domain nuclease of toxin-antitoxin system|nr:type II toxin-antitoxin system VapC family toxin [Tepidisphaeraceae bacterium]
MILLDTQVCFWWSTNSPRLSPRHRQLIDEAEPDGLAISSFTVWEVAMLSSRNKVPLHITVDHWLDQLLAIPTLHILPASPKILIESTRLPGEFHKDPADRIIVATARDIGSPLLTTDRAILAYSNVRAIGPDA